MTSGAADVGERVLSEIEEAAGTRPNGCPWAALSDPFVQAVIKAYRWHEKGELDLRWGHDPPHALMLGLEVFGAALTSVGNHDAQKRHEERERKRAEPPQQTPPRPRRPTARR